MARQKFLLYATKNLNLLKIPSYGKLIGQVVIITRDLPLFRVVTILLTCIFFIGTDFICNKSTV